MRVSGPTIEARHGSYMRHLETSRDSSRAVLEGTVLELDETSLRLLADSVDAPIVLPLDAIQKVDVRTLSDYRKRGTVIGGLSGGASHVER